MFMLNSPCKAFGKPFFAHFATLLKTSYNKKRGGRSHFLYESDGVTFYAKAIVYTKGVFDN